MRRLSAAEATATQAFEEVGEMRDALADLRERLAQARSSPETLTSNCVPLPGQRSCEMRDALADLR